jgi:hypothetical protein
MYDMVKLPNGKTVAWDEFSKWSENKQRCNLNNKNIGSKRTEEQKLKIKNSRIESIKNGRVICAKGADDSSSRKIITPLGVFGSVGLAAIAHGTTRQTMQRWLKDIRNTGIFMYEDKSFENKRELKPFKTRGRKISTPMGQFNSVLEAGFALGIHGGKMNRLLKDRTIKDYYYLDDPK